MILMARRLLPESLRSLPIIFDTDAIMSLEGALEAILESSSPRLRDPSPTDGTSPVVRSGRRLGLADWG